MGTIVLDVKNRIASLKGMTGRQYLQRVSPSVIVTFRGPGSICKQTG